ncbi:MAG: twin-arginine translocase subunit TatC [Bacteroidales bacterium]|nr:twin-arginine translocase subunit TatC [Bacteroidales bacterium]
MAVEDSRMSFGNHLEELRQMIIRILIAIIVCAIIVFWFKEETFALLLAPRNSDFITFKVIERLASYFGNNLIFEQYDIKLISTELSAQFMAHLEVACMLGALIASPFVIYELFKFISPALYENEKRYSVGICTTSYILFMIGFLMNYFILFPIAFRFLGTYQIDNIVQSQITITSYISTFITLSLAMGLIFELPVMSFILGKIGLIKSAFMKKYRGQSLIIIMIISAFITPPDLFTLFLVSIPLYLLYELSILIVAKVE